MVADQVEEGPDISLGWTHDILIVLQRIATKLDAIGALLSAFGFEVRPALHWARLFRWWVQLRFS